MIGIPGYMMSLMGGWGMWGILILVFGGIVINGILRRLGRSGGSGLGIRIGGKSRKSF